MRVPEVKKLKNGLRVCIIPRTCVNSVTIHLKGLVGSNYETPDQIGTSHLLEHLNLLKGNKNKILANGGKVLGVTSRDDVLYMTKMLKEDVLAGLEFLSHIFDKNNFSNNDLATQKKIVIQEIKRSQNIPEKIINTLSYKILFPNDRLSIKNIGYENHIKSLGTKNIDSFQNKYYSPNNFVLVLCGNIKQSNIFPYIEKLFGRIPKGKSSSYVTHNINIESKTQTIKSVGLKQSYTKIDFYGYKTGDDRRYSATVLASIIDTLLKNLIREKLGFVYGMSCNAISTGSYGIFSVIFSCEKEKASEVKNIILDVLKNVQKIMSTRNVEHVKKKVIADATFRFEKTSQVAEYYSDILLHGSLNQNHLYDLKAIKAINTKKVSAVALEILTQEAKITILTG